MTGLKFAETHEWAKVEEDIVVVGLSEYAVEQLSDIVYVDLPKSDDDVSRGGVFGEVESVKSVAELNSPVDGKIVEVNKEVNESPDIISEDPYGKGWLIKIKAEDLSQLDYLMTATEYDAQVDTAEPPVGENGIEDEDEA